MRLLIYSPEINPYSFVLLFAKGASGHSWSIRDYSREAHCSVRYAREFGFDLAEVQSRAIHVHEAPSVSTTDLKYWHEESSRLNEQFGIPQRAEGSEASKLMLESGTVYPCFRMLELLSLNKAKNPEDMKRIQMSPNSEDWVTWNAFALVRQFATQKWWQHFVRLAGKSNPQLDLPANWHETPHIDFWRDVESPPGYEKASRLRLRSSDNPGSVARSWKRKAVEGPSEVEIILTNPHLMVVVEAKLGSDISPDTTHDPERNQIIRNIDCLLEICQPRVAPMFWMLVRDVGEGRSYTQLMRSYRANPDLLIQMLPHRNPEALQKIAASLAIVLWKDFMSVLSGPPADEEAAVVYRELLARIQ